MYVAVVDRLTCTRTIDPEAAGFELHLRWAKYRSQIQKALRRGRQRAFSSKSGSPGGTRTPDQLVNSQLLYRLSYRGKVQAR